MGLDLKGRRGPLLVLIALGLAIVAAIVAGIVLTAGGNERQRELELDTSFTEPADYDSVDAVYAERSRSPASRRTASASATIS